MEAKCEFSAFALFSLASWKCSIAWFEQHVFLCLLSDTDPNRSNSVKGINFPKLTNFGRKEMKCCLSVWKDERSH